MTVANQPDRTVAAAISAAGIAHIQRVEKTTTGGQLDVTPKRVRRIPI